MQQHVASAKAEKTHHIKKTCGFQKRFGPSVCIALGNPSEKYLHRMDK